MISGSHAADRMMDILFTMYGLRHGAPVVSPENDFDGDVINRVPFRTNSAGQVVTAPGTDTIELKKASDGSYYMPQEG